MVRGFMLFYSFPEAICGRERGKGPRLFLLFYILDEFY